MMCQDIQKGHVAYYAFLHSFSFEQFWPGLNSVHTSSKYPLWRGLIERLSQEWIECVEE